MKFIVFSICLLILFASSLYALDLNDPVLYLPFDEGSGETAKDVSGHENDGEFLGNVTWVDGQYGKAVQISDDALANAVVVKDNETLQITGPLAIALWVKIKTMPDGECCLLTKSNMYMIHTSTWGQRFPFNRGGGVEVEPIIWAAGQWRPWQSSASVPVSLNEWHHVLVVYDGATILNYIDGELKGEFDKGGAIPVAISDVVIGRDSRGWEAGIPAEGRKSTVIVDEVMIFNRAVSADEVKVIMAGLTPVHPYDRLSTTWGSIKGQ